MDSGEVDRAYKVRCKSRRTYNERSNGESRSPKRCGKNTPHGMPLATLLRRENGQVMATMIIETAIRAPEEPGRAKTVTVFWGVAGQY